MQQKKKKKKLLAALLHLPSELKLRFLNLNKYMHMQNRGSILMLNVPIYLQSKRLLLINF